LKVKKLDNSDFEAFVSLLNDAGMKCFRNGEKYNVKSCNGGLIASIKLGNGCIMSTHAIPGFETEPTYSGRIWDYYVVI